jgi:UDP-N-acetylmuramate: L-alanyl-gamma-D-glutamyl-meso-diaminopimelate ligase
MNLDNMVVGQDLSKMKNKIKKIFFYRICGTGMGACACIAKEAGLEVAGADMTFSPPMSTYLETLDIPLMKLSDLTAEYLQRFDLVVVGNSVPRLSEYASFVEECGVPFTSFPSFLGEFLLKEKEVIGICGTHGKTTTSYFLTQMLEKLGIDTGYFIGGIMDGRPPSKFGKDKLFVIEADEYDSAYFQKISKFRLYELNHMVLTSLEFDHADIFNSIEDIKNEFSSTIPSLPGKIIANDDYKAIWDLNKLFNTKDWSFYGDKTEEGPLNIETDSKISKFSLKIGNSFVPFETNVIGKHNILNISSCLLLLDSLGYNTVELQDSIKELELVKRRQEIRGEYRGAIVIDDFAHHPKAITLTVDAIKNTFPNKKIITIFEPISATARSSIFQNEFTESLKTSDKVILAANTLQTTVEDSSNLNCNMIVDELNKTNIESIVVSNLDKLQESIDSWVNEDSVLLILSNRTCLGLWESDFVQNLS